MYDRGYYIFDGMKIRLRFASRNLLRFEERSLPGFSSVLGDAPSYYIFAKKPS